MNDKIQRLFNDIEVAGLLEDRREYDRDDLKRAYDLSDAEADALYEKIQWQFRV